MSRIRVFVLRVPEPDNGHVKESCFVSMIEAAKSRGRLSYLSVIIFAYYGLLFPLRSFHVFDIAPFNEKTLHEAGESWNWTDLKKILDPITKSSFAVEDLVSQHLVDTAHKLFDESADEFGRGATLGILVNSRAKETEHIELLLSAGVHPDTPDDEQDRLSHLCGSNGWREAAGAIVLCRPDMAARNDKNETPLMAATSDNYEVRVGLDRI